MTMRHLWISIFALALTACGSSTAPSTTTANTTGDDVPAERIAPPPSGPARDVHLPAIARTQLANGLEINTVRSDALPLAYVRLVIRGGIAASPEALPGLSRLVAKMLKEGTRTRTSSQLAEQIEYLGADLFIADDQSSIVIQIRALSEHLDTVMQLLADMA